MRHRATSDSGNAVSLFPFLAVLLCTMGALLVLLVVLSQRAGERVLAEVEEAEPPVVEQLKPAAVEKSVEKTVAKTVAKAIFKQPTPDGEKDAEVVAQLVSRLEELKQQQEKIDRLRQEAKEQLRDEQAKLTHLEDHTRRLEHELARLHMASEQLAAAENKQTVDQQQAERELERLQRLAAEKKKQVEELQESVKGKKSYAIVEYYGQDGIAVPRIYIECSSKGVVIQPEGTRFERADFIATGWSGNPLAKVVRATQYHLQEIARRSGQPVVEPLPLLIVRPQGTKAMRLVRAALEAAEIDYGFDFVGGEKSIRYPATLDTKLAKTQHHAWVNARRELASHIAAAPSKYQHQLRNYASQAGGNINSRQAKQLLIAQLQGSNSQTQTQGQLAAGTSSRYPAKDSSEETRYGAYREGSNAAGDSNEMAAGDSSFAAQDEAGGDSLEYSSGVDNASQSLAASGGGGGASENFTTTFAANADPDSQLSDGSAPTVSGQFNDQSQGDSDTQNLAQGLNERRPRNSVAIQRPIQVVVRADQFALIPSRHVSDRGVGTVISMRQSTKQIGEDLVAGLRDHMEAWGIAGQGLYWKPVLSLKVGPDGVETAQRLAKMLRRSGFQVSLPDERSLSQGGKANATR